MSQPLAPSAGNATELRDAMRYLRGEHCPARLHQTVLALGAEMLMLGQLADTPLEAQVRLADALHSGQAAQIFGRMCSALGGPTDFVERYDHYLPQARLIAPVFATAEQGEARYISHIDTRALGLCVVRLSGRSQAGTAPDASVGLSQIAELGQALPTDQPLAYVHANDAAALEQAKLDVCAAFDFSAAPPARINQLGQCYRAHDTAH